MEFHGTTFRRPPTVPEREFPAGVIVENELHVWAISRWRGARELAEFFLNAGYRHLRLPPGAPRMFTLEEYYDGNNNDGNNNHVIGYYVRFRNPYDAFSLLGQAFWCGCEFIFFTTYNVFTNFHDIFPSVGNMHAFPYPNQAAEE